MLVNQLQVMMTRGLRFQIPNKFFTGWVLVINRFHPKDDIFNIIQFVKKIIFSSVLHMRRVVSIEDQSCALQ